MYPDICTRARYGGRLSWLILADYQNLGRQNNLRRGGCGVQPGTIYHWERMGKAVCYNGLGMVALREGSSRSTQFVDRVSTVFHKLNVWRELDCATIFRKLARKLGR
jgi:hypothetical protein